VREDAADDAADRVYEDGVEGELSAGVVGGTPFAETEERGVSEC